MNSATVKVLNVE